MSNFFLCYVMIKLSEPISKEGTEKNDYAILVGIFTYKCKEMGDVLFHP